MARMDFADIDQILVQSVNPKRRKTAAWQRYERYKTATTVEEARSLGANGEDLRHDFSRAFAVVAPVVSQEETLQQGKAPSEASLHEAPQGSIVCHVSSKTKTASEQAFEVTIQRVQQELVAAEARIAELEAQLMQKSESLSKLETELAQARAREASLHPGPRVQSLLAQVYPHGPDAVLALALKACASVELRASVEERRQIQATATWVKWVVSHIPCDSDILRTNHARVLAAVVLHAAWGLERGQGLPLARTLEHAIACSWRVLHGARLQILLMKGLGITASDCVQSKAVYSKVIRVMWARGPVGLPGPPPVEI